jgi:type IV pilus assembly protein PilY1
MNTRLFFRQMCNTAFIFCALIATSHAALTDISTAPMAADTTTVVAKPNVMFTLDDSGSMDWDYMPDDAKSFASKYGFNSNHCNGVYYDSTFTYDPPVYSDGTSYPNASFTAAWKDGYNTGAGTVNLNNAFTGGSGTGASGAGAYTGPAFYYTYSGTQNADAQMDFRNTTGTFYRECNSTIGASPGNSVFSKTRLSSTTTTTITLAGSGGVAGATITVGSSGKTAVNDITVTISGVSTHIMSAATGKSTNTSTVAASIATNINKCTAAKTGLCTITGGTGYSATASSNVVTIMGPSTASGVTPAVVDNGGGMTFNRTAFPTVTDTTVSSIRVNGVELMGGTSVGCGSNVSCTAGNVSSPIFMNFFSATASGNVITITGPASASTYTPVVTVASGNMTFTADAFPESTPSKLQNFANWYSYYSTRMLTMKTGVGQAFKPVTDHYRVGFMTMNNNVSPGIVDIADFTGGCAVGAGTCQKDKWYTKLYASRPGNMTPLREALSHVGQLYAHKFGNVTTYTATLTVSGSGITSVDSILVGGTEIMNDSSVSSNSTSTVAANIADQINAMAVTDFGATSAGNVVTIQGPASAFTPTVRTPVISNDGGGMTFNASAFTSHTTNNQLNGISPADPMQYSCQQNFVILSTDGYWNGSTTYKLDNTTVGQQDGTEPRPMNDGYTLPKRTTTQILRSTSQPKQRTQQLQSSTTTLLSSSANLQSSTWTLQSSTANLQSSTWPLQSSTSNLQSQAWQLQSSTKATSGGTYSTPANASTCTYQTSTYPKTKCSYVTGTLTDVSTCTNVSKTTSTSDGSVWDPNARTCQYSSYTTPATVSSCTYQGKSAGSPYTVGVATTCSYSSTQTVATVTSCIPVAKTTSTTNGTVWDPAAKTCGYASYSAASPAASCTYQGQSSGSPNSGPAVTCSYGTTPTVTSVTSCTPLAKTSGTTNGTVWTPSAVTCGYGSYSTPAGVSSCTAVAQSTSSPYEATATTCSYSAASAPVNVSTCTPIAQSTTSPYTIGTAVSCPVSDSGWSAVSSCVPSVSGGQTITCDTITSGPTAVASCTSVSPSFGNSYTTTNCNTVTNGPSSVASCTASAASSSNNYTNTTCIAGANGTSDTLADVAEYYYKTDLRDQSLGNCPGVLGSSVCDNNVLTAAPDLATWQHMTTFTLGLGARGKMVNSPGYMNLTTACDPATDGDFCSILIGTTANGSNICPWQSSGTTCNWPTPSSGAIENIDDLWHAAVNGRGNYFSARDPKTLAAGLTDALSGIGARVGTSAAAATSNPNVSSGDNFVFSSSYTSVDWFGELTRQEISLSTGAVSANIDWQAQAKLDTLAATTANGGSRNIYTYNPSATAHTGDSAALTSGKLKSFSYTNLTSAEQAYFDSTHVNLLSQAAFMSGTDITAATGANLVNYLRGDRTNEGNIASTSKYYRARSHVLGDIVNAEVAYVKQAQFSYGDTNYSDFVTAQASRIGMVYAASNDGMLHAFYGGASISCVDSGGTTVACDSAGAIRPPCGTCGDEAWAYIPSFVIPDLYLLADKNYSTNHRYLVDGTPISGDICPNAPSSTCTVTPTNQWKSILVGGLNLGGRGYYALDITVPTAPKVLWEFSDPNMGYTFGNPQITKLADGTWVVLVTSGYNNVPNADGTGGDGVGRLYVLNANTGAVIRTISTGVGSVGAPSGLARISARVRDPASDNTVMEVYGGDLFGNLWRFDVNNNVGSSTSNYEAQLLATLKDPSGIVQPITTKPEVGIVNNQLVVFVGTGRFLGNSDLTDTQVQTMYAVKDPLVTTSVPGTAIYNGPQASTCGTSTGTNCFVRQIVTNTTCPNGTPASICSPGDAVRTGSNNTVDFNTQSGWFINMPDSGERDNTDSTLALGTLGFTSNTPSSGVACTVIGYSYRWFLNYRTGAPVSSSTTGVLSTKLSDTFATRPVYVRLPTNAVVELTRTSDGTTVTSNVSISAGGGSTRRTSWRELIVQ